MVQGRVAREKSWFKLISAAYGGLGLYALQLCCKTVEVKLLSIGDRDFCNFIKHQTTG